MESAPTPDRGQGPDAHGSRPALHGTTLALASALAFGLTTPLVQRAEHGAGACATAALLYAGAALVSLPKVSAVRPVLRAHAIRVAVVAACGAFVAPGLLAWGLLHASGARASLMLNLEAVFTIVLAWLLYREHAGRRVLLAAALVTGGGAALIVHASGAGPADALGLVAVAGAALFWAMDNALAKPLASHDATAVVLAKSTLGALLSVTLSFALGETWPAPASHVVALIALGATGYGISLRLYVRAQRSLGAARTASVFATGPFFGAALAWSLGEPFGAPSLVAAGAMIFGVYLHMTERHAHPHHHHAVSHEHAHRHDDGHHTHAHDPMPDGEHTHAHDHQEVEHSHAHVADADHEHEHAHDHEQS